MKIKKKNIFSSTSSFEPMPDLLVSQKNSEIERILSTTSDAINSNQNYQRQHSPFSAGLQNKFQAVLITPSGSKDDLTNRNVPLSGRKSASKPPPSPFVRKVMENQSINNNFGSNKKLVIFLNVEIINWFLKIIILF